VRAGLELIGAVNALEVGTKIQTRVGIATGLVVVGDLIGAGEAPERGIVGETPNRESGVSANDEHAQNSGEVGRQALSNAVYELIVFLSAAHVSAEQHHD
jgi:class 3 adenylate cyclase